MTIVICESQGWEDRPHPFTSPPAQETAIGILLSPAIGAEFMSLSTVIVAICSPSAKSGHRVSNC